VIPKPGRIAPGGGPEPLPAAPASPPSSIATPAAAL